MAGVPQFIATVASGTDITPGTGIDGANALAPAGEGFVMATASTVLCEYLPVAAVGDLVSPHGNFSNPHMPGFNPACEHAFIVEGSSTILVNGKPMAVVGPLGSLLSCGHWLQVPRTERSTSAGV
jgi:uncharacterized Zn-binding protein involved in type VI secretion